MPVALAIFIFLVYLARLDYVRKTEDSVEYQLERGHTIKVQHVWAFLLLTYVVLPPVAQKQLQSLDCIPFYHDGSSFLRVDTIINCRSDDYLGFRNIVITFICIYQTIPLLWFIVLYRKRKKLNPDVSSTDIRLAMYIRDRDEKLAPIRFLFDSYKINRWWFEVAEVRV
jgi:hypothetical protein